MARRGRIGSAEHPLAPDSEDGFVALAKALAGSGERSLPAGAERAAAAIAEGADPLGDALCALRSAADRRRTGMVYTPRPIVDAMIGWAATQPSPVRIVDAGSGTGRFLLAASRRFPKAKLVASESDPLAVLGLRANAAVAGFAHRLQVHAGDHRELKLPAVEGPTLFVGNPPYVRHHDIAPKWKEWLAEAAAEAGIAASRLGLAGLHVHFVVHSCRLAKPGDYGTMVTSAEWLDTNYGTAMRSAFLDVLGGTAMDVVEPAANPFPGTAATAAIFRFRVGERSPAIRFRSVADSTALADRHEGRAVPRGVVAAANRWSPFLRPSCANAPHGHVRLGDLCRVHRGQVTGCNAAWVAGGYDGPLPAENLIPAVTKARELIDAGERLANPDALRRVIDLPAELDELGDDERWQVARFLRWAKGMGADASYVARHRRAWWAVGLREAAPILCTYMARRPPAFVTNPLGVRHLNIAHGLYPRDAMPASDIEALAGWLRVNVRTSSGRTYAGGLTKFEPREVERILVPPLDELRDGAAGRRGDAWRAVRESNPAPAG